VTGRPRPRKMRQARRSRRMQSRKRGAPSWLSSVQNMLGRVMIQRNALRNRAATIQRIGPFGLATYDTSVREWQPIGGDWSQTLNGTRQWRRAA
jgi:hypothetical protein